MSKKLVIASPLILSLFVVGAEAQEDPGQHYESALRYFQTQSYESSIIELKSALQQSPNHLPSRILLGRSYLAAGQAVDAEQALRKALSLNADRAIVVVPLGYALLMQGKYQDILADVRSGTASASIEAEILQIRASAYLQTNNLNKAEEAFQGAIRLTPYDDSAKLGLSSLYLSQNKIAEAKTLIQSSLSSSNQQPQAWNLLGLVEKAQGNTSEAIAAFNRALQLDGDYVPALKERARWYQEQGEIEKALDDIVYLRELVPYDPQATFMYVSTLQKMGQKENAIKVVEELSNQISKLSTRQLNSQSNLRLINGLSYYIQENWESAYSNLVVYADANPSHVSSQLLVANLETRKGKEPQALIRLLKTNKGQPLSVEYWRSASELALIVRDYTLTSELLKQGLSQHPDNNRLLKLKAQYLYQTGDLEASLDLLYILQKRDDNENISELISQLQLGTGQLEQAEATVASLLEANPNSVNYLNLSASIDMKANKLSEAESTLRRALELEPENLTSLLNLAELQLASGLFHDAYASFDSALKLSPSNILILEKMARTAVALGDSGKAAELLEKRVNLRSGDIDIKLDLINLYMDIGKYQQAQTLIQTAGHTSRLDQRIISRRARLSILLNDPVSAESDLNLLFGMSLDNADKLAVVSDMALSINEVELAQRAIKRGLVVDPNNVAILTSTIRMQIRSGESAEAQASITKLQSQSPETASQLAVSQAYSSKDPAKIEIALTQHHTAFPSRKSALALYALFNQQKKAADGQIVLANWLVENPNDAYITKILANSYSKSGNVDQALALYQNDNAKQDPQSLNNLANLIFEKSPKEAIELAKKAYELAPQDPAIADTYGWLLAKDKQYNLALKYLRIAEARASSQPSLQYHLGQTLYWLGRKEEAKILLERAVQQSFPERAAAQDTLALINN